MNKGKVKISITGKNVNFFIKRMIINKINYSKYKVKDKNKVELVINYVDYLKIKDTTIYEIKIMKYYGFIKYLNFIKENSYFVISFLISFVLEICGAVKPHIS